MNSSASMDATTASRCKLKRLDVDLLAGRVINRQFFPLTAAELRYEVDSDRVLRFGLPPQIQADQEYAPGELEAYACRVSYRCMTYVLQSASMDRTLTLRLDREQDQALTRRVKAAGTTRSAWVRDIIDKALADLPLGSRVGHLRGRVELPRARSAWRRELKDRNWR